MKYLCNITLLALFLVSACSTTPPLLALSPEQAAAKRGYAIVKAVKQVQDYRLSGWSYIDQQNLVMYSSSIDNIALDTRTGVLMAGLDAIKILPRHGVVLQPCYIEGIYLLEKIKQQPDSGTSSDEANTLAAR